MTGNEDRITIQKANTSYRFDQQIKSGEGELAGLKIKLGKIESTYRKHALHSQVPKQ